MNKITKILTLTALMAVVSTAHSQISHGGSPQYRYGATKNPIPVHTIHSVDNQKYLQEDIEMVKDASPLRMGIMIDEPLSILEHSTMINTGTQDIFLCKIASEGAHALALYFDRFVLPEGAELYFYDQSGDVVIGKYIASDVKNDGRFYTQAIPGNTITIEYHLPKEATSTGDIHLAQVCHFYKDMFKDAFQSKGYLGTAEGNCWIDVACPEGANWGPQIRSVCDMLISTNKGAYLCTGALINNTNNDFTPYVLSAYHCQDLQFAITGWTFYFNYETTVCGGSNGVTTHTMTGAEIVAKGSSLGGSDFLLLRLNQNVPNSYQPYFAGWNRSYEERPSIGCGIHHPAGDWKKISIPAHVSVASGYTQNNLGKIDLTNFYQSTWVNKGVTAGGSSGSPLFNGNGLIIGQLYGGRSNCANIGTNDAVDYYGRLTVSWIGKGSAGARLSDWLDPKKTGVKSLAGLNFDAQAPMDSALIVNKLTIYPNPSSGMVHLSIDEIGEAEYQIYEPSGIMVKEGKTIITSTSQGLNLTDLHPGTYQIVLYINEKRYSNTIVIYH